MKPNNPGKKKDNAKKEEEDVDDSANEERQYAECLEIDLLKNKADEMDEDINKNSCVVC